MIGNRWVRLVVSILFWGATLWTLQLVAWVAVAALLDPLTVGRVYGYRVGEQVHSAVGLTYRGRIGGILGLVQMAAVLLALFWSRSRAIRRRRFALLVLVAWAMLWFTNRLWLTSRFEEPTIEALWPTACYALLAVAHAIVGWRDASPAVGP